MSKYFIYIVLLVTSLLVLRLNSNSYQGISDENTSLEVIKITQKFVNVYVIKTGGKYLLVDSGIPNKSKQLIKELKKCGISASEIDYLILTHAHPDHAGNAFFLQKNFGIKIIAGKGDKKIIAQKGKDSLLCPTGIIGKIVKNTIASQRYDVFTPDILIEKPYDLLQLSIEGKIIPLAGHTPGSLILKMGNAVFTGDIIKGQNLNSKKPARHIFICDYEQNLKNIETVAQLENIKWWYPGHGGRLKQEDIKQFINKRKK